MGIGAHIRFQNYPDYTVATNTVLVSTTIGQAVPSVLIGAGFTTGAYKIHPPIGKYSATRFGKAIVPSSIFVNAQVPVGSSISSDGSINGFTFGVGYKVQEFLEILVGFSFAQYNDPSVGFRNAAAAVIAANAQLPSDQQVPLYSLYNADDIRKDKPDALDGFPLSPQLKDGTTGGQIYSGSALLNHYRGGLFLGLAYPLSISKIFQSKQ